MQRIIQFLIDARMWAGLIGFLALTGLLFLGARFFEISMQWISAILVLGLMIFIGGWFLQRWQAEVLSDQLGNLLGNAIKSRDSKTRQTQDDMELMRRRMVEVVNTIKSSKLGLASGSAALYELPWYMVIGNPAAGKSSAIANSGLRFPFADKEGSIIQGVGGTRNCDWFFTTDGILLDTAGRYAIYEEDRDEWLGFLKLLKKFRNRAPINGIIIAVSIPELLGNRPEFSINLAKNLRQRVQELTERLEVFAPVYIMFTKVDLIAGFNEFFRNASTDETARVWGATQTYTRNTKNQDVVAFFDERFDELYEGLKAMSLANISLNMGKEMLPAFLTFPLEFASIKNALRAFILTLFEDNPYQFRPVFRGFYFTSALQDGLTLGASSQRVADRFDLSFNEQTRTTAYSKNGYFLVDLFRKVIFADKSLVAQYASRLKLRFRYLSFLICSLLFGLCLAVWSWSYQNNTQLLANVQADLEQVNRLQEKQLDLQSTVAALEIMQDRILQLQHYREEHPISLGWGLYEGELMERKLREEYFLGIREIILKPVTTNLEIFLDEVQANTDKLTNKSDSPGLHAGLTLSGSSNKSNLYQNASPINIEDAYNGLKTYLMLGDRSIAEVGHLNDQITRFWRGWLDNHRGQMQHEQMIRSAEKILNFYLTQVNDPSWPTIETKLALVDKVRASLRKVVHGMPARERVYAEIKARAATRFTPISVANIVSDQDLKVVGGSFVISGAYTRQAWEGYIHEAFKEVAIKQLQSTDWVLKTSSSDDLTLEGSPEQIEKSLTEQYKNEYAEVWENFLKSFTIAEFASFDKAVVAMNLLGDPQNSPINKLIDTVYQQTSWDNSELDNADLQQAQSGFMAWINTAILRQAPRRLSTNVNISPNDSSRHIPMGFVSQHFSGVARLVVAKDKDQPLLRRYISELSKLRSRFNQIYNQGDVGPETKKLMQQTLDGNGSELSDALKYIDEQVLQSMADEQKQALRPLLVRPLIQAFNAIIKPTEVELNKIWEAQVYNPFQLNLAGKYPFKPSAQIEASGQEIGQIFGPDGSIAKFFGSDMTLVVHRGALLASRTWADLGISLSPQVISNFSNWIGPVSNGGVATGGGEAPETMFQIQPLPAEGILEYSIEIDGQQLRFQNSQSSWANFIWPNTQGTPGAKISAVTFDGRSVEVINEPGRFGLERLLSSAARKPKSNGIFELSWENEGVTVAVNLKLISSPQASSAQPGVVNRGYRGMSLPSGIIEGLDNHDKPIAEQDLNEVPLTMGISQ